MYVSKGRKVDERHSLQSSVSSGDVDGFRLPRIDWPIDGSNPQIVGSSDWVFLDHVMHHSRQCFCDQDDWLNIVNGPGSLPLVAAGVIGLKWEPSIHCFRP